MGRFTMVVMEERCQGGPPYNNDIMCIIHASVYLYITPYKTVPLLCTISPLPPHKTITECVLVIFYFDDPHLDSPNLRAILHVCTCNHSVCHLL